MTLIQEIQATLTAYGITDYTDATIQVFIDNAKRLVDSPLLEQKEYVDYVHDFEGDIYLTDFYPVIDITSFTVNDKEITLSHTSPNGVLYLPYQCYGILKCEYVVGLSSEDVEQDLTPIVVKLIMNKEGQDGISSISEGDVSISYNNTDLSQSLDTLIGNLKNKYDAMVRLV